MIIQCEKCKTRFRLDDSKISEAGVRVRCSRCTHTFVVRREAERDFDSILQGWGGPERQQPEFSAVAGQGDAPVEQAPSGEAAPPPEPEMKEPSVKWEEERCEASGQSAAGPVPEEEFPGLSRMAAESAGPSASGETSAGGDEDKDFPVGTEDAAGVSSPAGETAAEGFRNDEDEGVEAVPPQPDRSDPVDGEVAAGPEPRRPVAGDIRAGEDEGLPPLSITSRRKGPPIFPIFAGIVLVLVAGAVGYFTVKNGGVGRLLPAKLRGLEKTVGEAAIRSLEGAFQANREAGELFVMRGEVFNASGRPLTSIRVTGTIYGKKGEVLARRTVFCGNPIPEEQAAFLPYSSMEKTMERQFGETLANLEVAPGKGVPFTIVFRDLPKDASDYGAKVAGPGE